MNKFRKVGFSHALRPIIFASCVATLGFSLTACNRSIEPIKHEPTKLVALSQNMDILTPVFEQNIGSSIEPYTVTSLQIGYDGNNIILASPKGMVTAYNRAGQQKWSVNIEKDIVGGVTYDSQSSTAIITTRDAYVVAFDTTNGTLRWQQKISGTVLSPTLIHDNRVVLYSNNGMLQGLSLQTGAPIWQFATQSPPISVRGAATPVLIDNNTALFATADGRLHSLEVATGIPRWSRRVAVAQGASEVERMVDIDSTPVVDNDQLYAVSYSGQLIGIDLATRQIMFVKEAASLRALTVTPQSVVVATLDGHVNAYDRRSGDLQWSNTDLAYRHLTNPVIIGNYIAVGDFEGVVHLLNSSNGQIVSRVSTKGALHGLQASGNTLLALSQSGKVFIWQE